MLPEWVTDTDRKAYFEYLDKLRESGALNMFRARSHLAEEFPELGRDDATTVLKEWMDTFSERHP